MSCAWGEMRVVRDVIKKSKLKNHWKDPDVSGRKILKYISVKYCFENVDWIQLLQDVDQWWNV